MLSSVFVFAMQIGFILRESGTVRDKNRHHLLAQNVLDMLVAAFSFFFIGFAIAFGAEGTGHFAGSSQFAG